MSVKLNLVGIVRSDEDPKKPYALQIDFAFGVVTQPCTPDELFVQMQQIIRDHGPLGIWVEVKDPTK